MSAPAGYVVTYISGNRTALLGEKKPENHEIMKSIEPFYLAVRPVLPADASMRPHLIAAYEHGFEHGKSDKTFMPTAAARRRIANIGAHAYLKAKHVDEPKPVHANYTAAAESLAFSIHGVSLAELSDKEQADVHRWARSTINAALSQKA